MSARRLRHGGLGVLVLLLAAAVLAGEPTGARKVNLITTTYPDLGRFIRAQTGKVVVVDFWSTLCVPCMEEFPHLVELENKYSKEGLVAVSVDLESPKNGKARERAEKFLGRMGGEFPHFMLDAGQDEWTERLKIDGPPCIFIFNRENRFVKKLPVVDAKGEIVEKVDFEVIEKLVSDLLKR
jgi:thiol-disulfide isomerase/thioredoxin